MPWAHVQSTGTFQSAAITSLAPLAYGSNVQAGTRLIAGCVWVGSGVGSVTCALTDSRGNTWTPVAASLATNGTAVARSQIFHAPSGTAGANSVTMTVSGTMAELVLVIGEFSGLSGSLGAAPIATSGAAANPSANITVDAADSLLIGAGFSAGSFTVGTGWTVLGAGQDGNLVEYRLPAGTGAQAVSFTDAAADQYTISGVEFRATGGAAPVSYPQSPLSILQMPFMVAFPSLPVIFTPQPVSPRPTVFDQTVDLDSTAIASAEVFGTLSVTSPTDQTVDADTRGIASAEAFGTHTVTTPTVQTISPTGITSAEAFGVDRVDQQVIATGIASAEAFGTARVDLNINPVGIVSAEAFGGLREDLAINPVGIASAEVFGVASVSASTGANVNPTGISSAEAFGTARVDLSSAPTGIGSAEAFGAATVIVTTAGTINPSGITSTEAFGVTRVDLSNAPTGIPSAEAFGVARVDLGVSLTGITSAEAFGSDRVDLQTVMTGIPSLLAFGSDRVDLSVLLTGIPSSEAFGFTDRIDESILMTAIPSGEAFGSIIVSGGTLAAGSRGDLATMGYGT